MNTDFYMAFAALLPVLFLAISIQSSFFLKQYTYQMPAEALPRNIHAASVATALILLVYGEGLALYALYSKHDIAGAPLNMAIIAGTAASFVIVDYLLTLLDKRKNIGLFFFYIFLGVGAILFNLTLMDTL